MVFYVTLHVSVWVEIFTSNFVESSSESRSTWACELKLFSVAASWVYDSHAPRERVSWNVVMAAATIQCNGHAPRERVSWNLRYLVATSILPCHAPRERVSWNKIPPSLRTQFAVTLHVSVWVEISTAIPVENNSAGHAPRERVSWNFKGGCWISVERCHAPRERVSWNVICEGDCIDSSSHAPRERVSWNFHHRSFHCTPSCHAPRERVSWNFRSNLAISSTESRSTWACELKFVLS